METLDCIKTRRSIRKYLDKSVAWDDIGAVLEAARYAPSSGNIQNWKFIIVLDADKREKIADAALQQWWMAAAPVHIVVCAEPTKGERYYGVRGERLYTIQNCAAAAENMLLAAHDRGLAACWVGAFDEDMVKKVLGIPEEVRPQIILTVGYADEKAPVPARHPIEAITYINGWRNKIKDPELYFGYYSALWPRAAKKIEKKSREVIEKIKKKISKK